MSFVNQTRELECFVHKGCDKRKKPPFSISSTEKHGELELLVVIF